MVGVTVMAAGRRASGVVTHGKMRKGHGMVGIVVTMIVLGAADVRADQKYLGYNVAADTLGVAADAHSKPIKDKMIEHRRAIHRYPERTFDEYEVRAAHRIHAAAVGRDTRAARARRRPPSRTCGAAPRGRLIFRRVRAPPRPRSRRRARASSQRSRRWASPTRTS